MAWVAGIFEGEGSLSQTRREHQYWVLCVSMTDRDVIERLGQLTGLGFVSGEQRPPSWQDNWKSYYRWQVNGQHDIHYLTDALYLWLGSRRRAKVDEFREHYSRKYTGLCSKQLHPWTPGSGRCKRCAVEYMQRRRASA